MNIDGVEADEDPKRLSEIKWQEEKIEWLKQLREDREKREKLKSKGESNVG